MPPNTRFALSQDIPWQKNGVHFKQSAHFVPIYGVDNHIELFMFHFGNKIVKTNILRHWPVKNFNRIRHRCVMTLSIFFFAKPPDYKENDKQQMSTTFWLSFHPWYKIIINAWFISINRIKDTDFACFGFDILTWKTFFSFLFLLHLMQLHNLFSSTIRRTVYSYRHGILVTQ